MWPHERAFDNCKSVASYGASEAAGSQRPSLTRSLTADTALRLARYFGMTPEFWLNLQKT